MWFHSRNVHGAHFMVMYTKEYHQGRLNLVKKISSYVHLLTLTTQVISKHECLEHDYFHEHGTDCLVLVETSNNQDQCIWCWYCCYEARHGSPKRPMPYKLCMMGVTIASPLYIYRDTLSTKPRGPNCCQRRNQNRFVTMLPTYATRFYWEVANNAIW